MQLASTVIERLSRLECPLVTSFHTSSGEGKQHINADEDLMDSLLLESGDLRERLLDWCLQKDGQVWTSLCLCVIVRNICTHFVSPQCGDCEQMSGEYQCKIVACCHGYLSRRGGCFCRSYHGQGKATSGWYFKSYYGAL